MSKKYETHQAWKEKCKRGKVKESRHIDNWSPFDLYVYYSNIKLKMKILVCAIVIKPSVASYDTVGF